MSCPNEDELIEALLWSDNEYSLEKFVERFKLPQLVRVEVGYFTASERTSLEYGQVLVLHSVEKTSKLVCETSLKNTVVIPLDCPVKVLVLPRSNDCKSMKISAQQLASLFSGDVSGSNIIKYVMRLDGYLNLNSPRESIEIDEILEIKHADFTDCVVKCTNMATGQTESIPLDSDVLFVPILDCKPYTLAEVKETFGLPVNVRFLDARPAAAGRTSDASMLVSSLGEVTIVDEIEHTVVVSTTVGGSDPRLKACLKIKNDLPVQVTAAKRGVQRAGENYLCIVDTLDKQFKRTRQHSSRHLYIYEHLDTVKKNIYVDVSSSVMIDQQPSDAEVRRRRPEFRSSDVNHGPAPPLPPKLGSSQNESTSPRSSRSAPKPRPRSYPKQAQKTQTAQRTQTAQITPPKPGPKPFVKHKSFSLPRMGQRLKPNARTASVTDELDRKASTVERWKGTSKSDGDYDRYAFLQPCKDEPIYEIPYTKSDSGGSTCKPTVLPNHPNSTPVPVTTTAQNSSPNSDPVPAGVTVEKHPISLMRGSDKKHGTSMARFPNDLSGLGVRQVGELLTELRMDCYVNMFREEFVDGAMLKSLDRESLESLGMTVFHQKKLIMFIEGWRPNI